MLFFFGGGGGGAGLRAWGRVFSHFPLITAKPAK